MYKFNCSDNTTCMQQIKKLVGYELVLITYIIFYGCMFFLMIQNLVLLLKLGWILLISSIFSHKRWKHLDAVVLHTGTNWFLWVISRLGVNIKFVGLLVKIDDQYRLRAKNVLSGPVMFSCLSVLWSSNSWLSLKHMLTQEAAD